MSVRNHLLLTFVSFLVAVSSVAATQLPPTPPFGAGVTSSRVSESTDGAVLTWTFGGKRGDVFVPGKAIESSLQTKRPAAWLERYAAQLEQENWQLGVRDKSRLVARKYAPFGEKWLDLRVNGRALRMRTVEFTFEGAEVAFGEMDSMEVMAQKLSGFFSLQPPTEADLPTAAHSDFPFLRHFPGAALRDDLTRTSDQLRLPMAKRDPGSRAGPLTLTGPTVTKVYVNRHPVTSFKQWMAYRLALTSAGWEIIDADVGYLDNAPWLFARYRLGERTLWARLDFQTSGAKFTVTDERK